ncbi:MAG: biotin/lipoate A/B protein ligase family protein [Cyanobacteria bacterium P01_C01_bin.118]
MTTAWRLIAPIEASGVTQMAIDEWLLEQHCLGYGLPCLRFYTWAPIAISLGYHQRQYPEHWKNLIWHGQTIDLVQRPSGGRAVLHQGDVTYSLITSGYRGRRRDIYEHLCQFLVEGWKRLGVNLYLGSEQRYQRSNNCFGTSTAADLVTSDGYKVIGSAQLYRKRCILQHGSIRLSPNIELVQYVFGKAPTIPPPAITKIASHNVIGELTHAAQQVFDIHLIDQPLSTEEQQQAVAWSKNQKHR